MDKRIEANLVVKKKLSDALFEILEEKGLGSVGISELVSQAGVSRSSFYRNFDSIDDVLAYGNQLLADEYYASCPYDVVDFTDIECITWQLHFWKEHAAKIVTLSHSGLAHASFAQVFEIGMHGVEAEESHPLELVKRRFALGAFYAIALDWVENGAPGSTEALARQYCTMLTCGFNPVPR